GSVNSYITSVEQKFDELEVGGRNLLIDSDFKESSNRFTYQRLDLERNGIELIATNDIVSTTSYPRILYKPLGNLEVGKQYTISFKAKSCREPFSTDYWVSTSSGGSRQITPQKPHYTEQWKKYEYTITINENFSDETAIQWWVNATNPTTKQTLHLKEIKMELGTIATDWTPAPEDYQSQIDNQDKVLTKHETEIEQNKLGLNTKVDYTEMNSTNKTLEKLLTEFSQTADGFNFRIDSNGMIQDLTFDRNAFKLNSNLIEFNDGDVVIKDGVTTIKDAY